MINVIVKKIQNAFEVLTKIKRVFYSIKGRRQLRTKTMTVDITDTKKPLISKPSITHGLRDEILQTYVIRTVETFERLGFHREALLNGVPLSKHDLSREHEDAMSLLSHEVLLKIYHNALELSSKKNLGLLFGVEMGMSAFGVVSYAILSTKKDFDAIATAARYQRLILGKFAEFKLEFSDQTCEIRFDVHTDNERLKRFYIDLFFANSVRFSSAIISHKTSIKVLHLSFDDPGYRAEYENLFDCEVVFNCDNNAILFDPSTLVIGLSNTNAATEQACSNVCNALLDSLIETNSIPSQVEHLLQEDFRYYSDMQRVADYFHCDQRTLRRRLSVNQSSFRDIRDSVFERLSTELLKQGDSIQDIAEALGYASGRTFRKAFLSLTGMNPTDYRSQAKSNDASAMSQRRA